ncbi:PREDICTED: SNARE-associated protein Snapin-like [Priapulus caudatus]|uniref:Biogenesis of lysosome-related organelles complex 1 subunit 7 n=1 Tax=Priapulus caudatus TaxID=37621 RepID=A0ABM1E9J5_PRICU|nr:PREDICTED: SNARE-associated protein Snapin-like [Priapulus caudatus]
MAEHPVSDSDSTYTNDTISERLLDISSRDALADGILGLLKPLVEEVDERVRDTRQSQAELRVQIATLAEELRRVSEDQGFIPLELDNYVKKLTNTKRRAVIVNNILQNVQGRLTKLHNNIAKEAEQKKNQLETSNEPTGGATSVTQSSEGSQQ